MHKTAVWNTDYADAYEIAKKLDTLDSRQLTKYIERIVSGYFSSINSRDRALSYLKQILQEKLDAINNEYRNLVNTPSPSSNKLAHLSAKRKKIESIGDEILKQLANEAQNHRMTRQQRPEY